MFLNKSLAQKRKRLRSVQDMGSRCTSERSWDFEEMLEALSRWALSMPWAVDRSSGHRQTSRRFMIECSDLSICQPWFAIEEGGNEWGNNPCLYVVLPSRLARKVIASGWSFGLETLGDASAVTCFDAPTSSVELFVLQCVLQAGYECAFVSPNRRRDGH